MHDGDLLQSIRLWTPEKAAVSLLAAALAEGLDAGYEEYRASVPDLPPPAREELLPLAATAVGRGLIQEALERDKRHSPAVALTDRLAERLRYLAWGDLLLVAACVHRDDGANRQLLALVESHVLPALARKWGRDRAQEVADDLPQKLHIPDEKGLNRGRPRLLAYGGRSRLTTWLQAVAHRQAIDRWRRPERQPIDDDLGGPTATAGTGSSADQLIGQEEVDLVRRIVQPAFEELMRQLQDISEQQHRFAYLRCVRGMDNIDIAEQLGVGKSRVTELSQQVFRKLMAIIRKLAPELGAVSYEPTKERRKLIEEALQEWFGDTASP
jgi:DNA-directed RNA polymerase specialized sigma24 family protein